MLIYREVTISREKLKSKNYSPDEVIVIPINELDEKEKEAFYKPVVELMYAIYKDEGGDTGCPSQ